MAPEATQWQGGAAETAFLGTLSTDMPWELIHEFSNYVRESGTEGEQQAVDAITRRLTAWGIPHTVHHPRCFISLPRGATVTVSLTDGTARTLRGTTPGFAIPTGDAGITAPAVAIETAHAASSSTLFSSGLGSVLAGQNVAGKIAVLSGLPMPARIGDLTAAGVAAAVFISPGTNVHEGICTSVWGTPDLDTIGAIPTLSVAEVNRPDGLWLMEQAKTGAVREVTVHTNLETRWREIPVTVAEIRGTTAPEEFVLVHGHLDSWGEGIGDNATGDATLLELARALHENRQPSRPQRAHRLVERPLARAVRGEHLVCGHLRPRSDRALRRAGKLRFPRLPLGDRVPRPLLHGRPRRVHAGGDPRCGGPHGGGRAAAARGRLFLQQPRHLRHIDALLHHAAERGGRARLLRRRRLRRQHRLAHRGRHAGNRRPREPGTGYQGLRRGRLAAGECPDPPPRSCGGGRGHQGEPPGISSRRSAVASI